MSPSPRRRVPRTRGFSAARLFIGLLAFGVSAAAAAAIVACETPPIGWQGAGRMQTLPAPQPDSGGAMTFDSGDGADASDEDSGEDAAIDDSGDDADSGDETGSPDDASKPKDAAPKDAAEPSDAGPADACTSHCG